MSTEPRPLQEHSPSCNRSGWIWQEQVLPHLPIIGRCTGCGAIGKRRPVYDHQEAEQ